MYVPNLDRQKKLPKVFLILVETVPFITASMIWPLISANFAFVVALSE